MASTTASTAGSNLKVYTAPSNFEGLYFLNQQAGTPLANEQVRQALSLAINRPSVASGLFGKFAVASDELSVPGYDGWDPSHVNHYKYDIATAKSMLTAAGYPNGFTLTVDSLNEFGLDTLTTALAGQLSQIGVTLNITVSQTIGDYVSNALSKNFDTMAMYYGGLPMYVIYQQLLAQNAGLFNPFQYRQRRLGHLGRCWCAARCHGAQSGVEADAGLHRQPSGGDARPLHRRDVRHHEEPRGILGWRRQHQLRPIDGFTREVGVRSRISQKLPNSVGATSVKSHHQTAFLVAPPAVRGLDTHLRPRLVDARRRGANHSRRQRHPGRIPGVTTSLGLNQPLWVQYWQWLDHVLHGNLGTSIFTGIPVTQLLNSRLAVSLTRIVGSTIIATVIGCLLGVIGALRGGFVASCLDVVSRLGIAVPNFVVGLAVIIVFAVKLHAFPATGFVPFSVSPGSGCIRSSCRLFTLSLAGITIIAQQTRNSMQEAMNLTFIRVLEANGFRRRSDRSSSRPAQRLDPHRVADRCRVHRSAQRHRARRNGLCPARAW